MMKQIISSDFRFMVNKLNYAPICTNGTAIRLAKVAPTVKANCNWQEQHISLKVSKAIEAT